MTPDSRLKRLSLGTASIFLLIVGTLLGIPQMYLMAVAISLIPVVYWFIGFFLLRGITCVRKMPGSCQRGDRVKIELIVTNTGVFPRFYIRAFDRLPRWVRFEGYETAVGTILLNLRQNEQAKLTYYVQPMLRGVQNIGPTKISNPDLIGLSSYSTLVGGTDTMLVYPEVLPVSSRFLSGGASHGWMDQENAATKGTGTDFQGVREYRQGDDLRRVNWKTTARTGLLAVTEYALGYVNHIAVALDLSASSYGATEQSFNAAFETAVEIAASLAVAALRNGSSVLMLANGNLQSVNGPLRGIESIQSLLTALALVESNSDEPLSQVVDRFSYSSDHDRSLIIVSGKSSMEGPIAESLQGIRRLSGGGMPLCFDVNSESFNITSPYSYYKDSTSKPMPPTMYEGVVGRNIIIRPETDLRELFARVSL
jgi:uncharacterized protein (DUF58 family)